MSLAKRILGEPLVHFAVIGLALFALERILSPDAEDPNLIRVDAAVYRDLAGLFYEGRGRVPTAEEMDEIVDIHLQNEVLFLEARALELDHGDAMMRERLISRMRLMLFRGIVLDNPGEDVLRPWYEETLDTYRMPQTISFRVIGLDGDEDEARAEADAANAREAQGEAKPSDRPIVNFRDRPRDQMVALFNDAFIDAIEAAPTGEWAPVPSQQGWQVVKFEGGQPGGVRPYEEVWQAVWGDWQETQRKAQANTALDAIMARYPVERETYDAAAVAAAITRANETDVSGEGAQASADDAAGGQASLP